MRKRKAFTLVELVVAMVIFSIISLMISSIISFSSKSYTDTERRIKAFESNTTFAIKLSDSIKKSSTAFTVPETTFNNLAKLTEGWNYLGLRDNVTVPAKASRTGREVKNVRALVSITYLDASKTNPNYSYTTENDSYNVIINQDGRFKEEIIGYEFELDGKKYTYNLTFEPSDEKGDDENSNHVKYTLQEITKEGNKTVNTVEYGTEGTSMTALNALQVVYRGSDGNPATALAFRADFSPVNTTQETGTKKAKPIIAFVLDLSGSMNTQMYDEVDNKKFLSTRFRVLRRQLLKFIDDIPKGQNAKIILVPFGNYAGDTTSSPIWSFDLNTDAQATAIKNYINRWAEPNGQSTNLGDGLRKAYYEIKNAVDATTGDSKVSLVMLTDGAMNRACFTEDYYYYTGDKDKPSNRKWQSYEVTSYYTTTTSPKNKETPYYYTQQSSYLARKYAQIWTKKIKDEIKPSASLINLSCTTAGSAPSMNPDDKQVLEGDFDIQAFEATNISEITAFFNNLLGGITEEMMYAFNGPKL